MKLKELIENIDKSDGNKHLVKIDDELIESLEILTNAYGIWKEQDRLVYYWMGKWYCIDSWVGWKVYFFDNEFVACTYQSGRKSDELWEWVSQKMFNKVRDYVKSLIKDEEYYPEPELIDMDEEMGNGYRIDFCGQLFKHHHNEALMNGFNVKIIEEEKEIAPYFNPKKVKVKYDHGLEQWVELKDLLFKWRVK